MVGIVSERSNVSCLLSSLMLRAVVEWTEFSGQFMVEAWCGGHCVGKIQFKLSVVVP